MTPTDLGYYPALEAYRKENGWDHFGLGRVAAQHRDRYVVINEEGDYEAELLGNFRYSVEDKNDLPVVGDWVAISVYDEGKALIRGVFPRSSQLERQAVGKFGEKQLIAANIDVGLIVQSVNRDFSINRLERYLSLCYASGIRPIIVITKIDLIDEPSLLDLMNQIKRRIENTSLIPVSNETKVGISELKKLIVKGKTYCLLGSSGVGKSSLINSMMGEDRQKTGSISQGIDRGKHITTYRELVLMENGAILIDNPGMREVGITDNPVGLEQTYEVIHTLASQCKFSDCTHTSESGCAVLLAVEAGQLDNNALENYFKMKKEQAHFTSTLLERKSKDKELGKLIREVKRIRKKHKF